MHRQQNINYLTIAVLLLNTHSIYSQKATTIASDFFHRFSSVENGWIAGDATISLLLPDNNTLWLFGDSFIGTKGDNYAFSPSKSRMINSSAIIQHEETFFAHYNGNIETVSSLIPADGDNFFWPQHATIENDTIKILAIKVIPEDNGTIGFNFRTERTYLSRFSYPELKHISTEPIPFFTNTDIRFGAHILKKDTYIYIFGVKDTSACGLNWSLPILARTKKSISEPWEFYAGQGKWSKNQDDIKTIGDRPMSESYFILEKDEKFYLIMHEIWTVGELYIIEANDITGPFNRASSGGKENKFCVIPSHNNNFTYNLFAHPHFKNNDDEILISFNVNTSDFASIYSDSRNYRARFLWMSIEDALTTTTPDTVFIFDDYSETTNISKNKNANNILYQTNANIYIKSTSTPAILSIYGINGKKYATHKVIAGEIIDISNIPEDFLILQLTNKNEIITKKIINQH